MWSVICVCVCRVWVTLVPSSAESSTPWKSFSDRASSCSVCWPLPRLAPTSTCMPVSTVHSVGYNNDNELFRKHKPLPLECYANQDVNCIRIQFKSQEAKQARPTLHAHPHTHMHTWMHACTQESTHAHTHMHARTHTCTHRYSSSGYKHLFFLDKDEMRRYPKLIHSSFLVKKCKTRWGDTPNWHTCLSLISSAR